MGPFSSIRAPFGGSLLRYRNQARSLVPKSGVEADAREWTGLAFGVAKNPIARVSILAMTVAVVPETSKVVDFLVEQGWDEKDGGNGTWTVTPAGRFWFESLEYGDVVTFYEYGGAVFLFYTRTSAGGRLQNKTGPFR